MFVNHAGTPDFRRVGAGCLALFYLGATSAVAHADALLDAVNIAAPDHVESPGDGCAVNHGHFFCQVVRSLAQAEVPGGVATEYGPAPPIRAVEAHREGDDAGSPPILIGSVIPRAPPA